MNAIQGFIAFLRCEANLADQRARSLRETAAGIEANAYLTTRHKKKRKRHGGETKTKRAHTGYTLFVHENYDAIKKRTGEDLSSKDVLAEVAQQWSDIGEQERLAWQFKAEQLKRAGSFPEEAIAEVGLPEPPSGESEDWGNRKRAARKTPPEKDLNSVSV